VIVLNSLSTNENAACDLAADAIIYRSGLSGRTESNEDTENCQGATVAHLGCSNLFESFSLATAFSEETINSEGVS